MKDDIQWVIDQHKEFLKGREVPSGYFNKLQQIAILIRKLRLPDNGEFWIALRRQGNGLLTVWQYLRAPYGLESGDIYWDIDPETIDVVLVKLREFVDDT